MSGLFSNGWSTGSPLSQETLNLKFSSQCFEVNGSILKRKSRHVLINRLKEEQYCQLIDLNMGKLHGY